MPCENFARGGAWSALAGCAAAPCLYRRTAVSRAVLNTSCAPFTPNSVHLLRRCCTRRVDHDVPPDACAATPGTSAGRGAALPRAKAWYGSDGAVTGGIFRR